MYQYTGGVLIRLRSFFYSFSFFSRCALEVAAELCTDSCDDAVQSGRVSGGKYIWKWLRKGCILQLRGMYVLPYKHNHPSPYLVFASKVTTMIVDSIVPHNAAWKHTSATSECPLFPTIARQYESNVLDPHFWQHDERPNGIV